MSFEAIRTAICSKSDSDQFVRLWDLKSWAWLRRIALRQEWLKEPEFVALFQQEVVTNLAVWGVAERIAFNVTTAASG
jgi:hypothetical protein